LTYLRDSTYLNLDLGDAADPASDQGSDLHAPFDGVRRVASYESTPSGSLKLLSTYAPTDCSQLSLLRPGRPLIGVFDSGMGGLSVLAHLMHELTHCDFVYLADTLRVPYGSRSSDEIRCLSLAAADWLKACGASLEVIACNSASAHSLSQIRTHHGDLTVVGLVPAIKPAAARSESGLIGLLATQATLEGELLKQVVQAHAAPLGVEVLTAHLPELVPWVESGLSSTDPALDQLLLKVRQWQRMGVDQLVLGCTHYPFFKEHLATVFTESCIHDSGAAVARRVSSLLGADSLQADIFTAQRLNVYSSGDSGQDQLKLSRLLECTALSEL
jgi:glutamate racemase